MITSRSFQIGRTLTSFSFHGKYGDSAIPKAVMRANGDLSQANPETRGLFFRKAAQTIVSSLGNVVNFFGRSAKIPATKHPPKTSGCAHTYRFVRHKSGLTLPAAGVYH
jgi:hypothetical protein